MLGPPALARLGFFRFGIVPAFLVGDDRGGARRSPGAGLVFGWWRDVAQYWIDDAPRQFDAVVTRKKRRVPAHGIAQQALIWRAFAVEQMARNQFRSLAPHVLARMLDPRAGG